MFQMRLVYNEHSEDFMEDITIQFINCHINTGLNLKDKRVE